MNQQQYMEQQLWAYIDGLVKPEEKTAIEKLLESNLEWKNKYSELLEMHQLIRSSELDQPSLRFTKNVMEEIAKFKIAPAAKNYINKKIIWGIAAFFMITIAVFLIYGFGQVEWNSGSGAFNKYVDINKPDFSKIFSNNFVNAFMMINVLLGLILLDRFLASKKKAMHKNA